jgi:hypothetical protein
MPLDSAVVSGSCLRIPVQRSGVVIQKNHSPSRSVPATGQGRSLVNRWRLLVRVHAAAFEAGSNGF